MCADPPPPCLLPATRTRPAMHLLQACLMLSLACLPSQAYARPGLPEEPSEIPPVQTVGEMLRLDALQALLAEKRKWAARQHPTPAPAPAAAHAPLSGASLPGASPLAGPALGPSTAPRLDALYGVGSELRARIAIDGVTRLYKSGRSTPLDGADDDWRLVAIAPPCVDLERSGARLHLCAQRPLSEVYAP